MKTIHKITAFSLLLLTTSITYAYDGPVDMVGGAITDASNQTFASLNTIAYTLFMSLALLQFVLKMVKLLSAGESDLGAVLGKVAMSITWIGVVFWLLAPVGSGLNNGTDIIQKFVDWFLRWASNFSGGGTAFSAVDIFNVGLFATHNIITSVAAAATGSVANTITTVVMPATAIFAALMLLLMNVFVLVSCAYIAIKVFMVKVELAIVLAVSPISFAFLGLDALRDQGIAPFKYGIAVMYRIVILGTIVGAMKIVSDNLTEVLATKVAAGGMTDIWTPILAAIFGYVLIAFVAHKSDSIAASLASGSTQMSSSDLASAVSTGVAGGLAIASGGAAMKSAIGKGSGALGTALNSMKNEMSVSNASENGNGASRAAQEAKAMNSLMDGAPPPMSSSESSAIGTEKPRDALADRSNVDKLLKGPEPKASATGNGASAGIGGATPSPSNKPSFMDRMSNFNQQVSRESSAVHVSINPHKD